MKHLSLRLAAVLSFLAPIQPVMAQGWLEAYEITTLPGPATAGRLRSADVFMARTSDLTPGSQNGEDGYFLDVHGYTHLHGHSNSPPICTDEPRYDQATPGGRCSGTLVGPTLVLTAGHCTPDDGDCSDRMFLFRDEIAFPNDPRGDSSTGVVFFPEDHVRACVEVVAQQGALPGDPTSTDEDLEMVQGTPGTDWGVMRMDQPAPAGALPLPVERYGISQAGDAALCLSHPARLPVKGQQGSNGAINADSITTMCYSLGGSSGGRVVNLKTGYLAGVHHWVTGFPTEPANDDPEGCENPCFTCSQVTTSERPFAPALFIDPIGLQLAPKTAVLDYYGPPTGSPADYAEQSVVVSAPNR